MTFGKIEREAWKEHIEPAICRFLQKVYRKLYIYDIQFSYVDFPSISAVSETVKWTLTPEEMAEREGEQSQAEKQVEKEGDERETLTRNSTEGVTASIVNTSGAITQTNSQDGPAIQINKSESHSKTKEGKGKGKERGELNSKAKAKVSEPLPTQSAQTEKSKRKRKPRGKISPSSEVLSVFEHTRSLELNTSEIPALVHPSPPAPTPALPSLGPTSTTGSQSAMAHGEADTRFSDDVISARGSPPRGSTAEVVTDSASEFLSPSPPRHGRTSPLRSPLGITSLHVTKQPSTLMVSSSPHGKRKLERTDDEEDRPAKRARKETDPTPSQSKRTGSKRISFPTRPSKSPEYVAKALEICELVSELNANGDAKWAGFVKAWLKNEAKAKYVGGKFVTKGRPAEVGRWIQCARPTKSFKPVLKLNSYTSAFVAWWDNMQPEGRTRSEDSFMEYSREEKWSWDKVVFGVNGAVNVVVALAWWRRAVYEMQPKGYREEEQAELEQERFEQALDEVSYVFNG